MFDAVRVMVVPPRRSRPSFGVQDFDAAVQRAVHRVQPAEQVFRQVETARRIGFESVNIDLIYGLPLQTPESFRRTLAQVRQIQAGSDVIW